jgi:hypothetical protein
VRTCGPATRAQFLVRLTARRRLPVMARLDDGSFLSAIGELPVRVVSAQVTVTCADGTTYTGSYRLATTLGDHGPGVFLVAASGLVPRPPEQTRIACARLLLAPTGPGLVR